MTDFGRIIAETVGFRSDYSGKRRIIAETVGFRSDFGRIIAETVGFGQKRPISYYASVHFKPFMSINPSSAAL